MGESVFEVVKQSVAVREAAEMYGIAVGRGGMACCPFHDDRHPSLKLNEDYFYCFGCGATGDVIDFTARLYDLSPKEAAEKLAQDFGLGGRREAGPGFWPGLRQQGPGPAKPCPAEIRGAGKERKSGTRLARSGGLLPPAPKMGDRLFPQDAGRGPAPTLFGGRPEKRLHGLSAGHLSRQQHRGTGPVDRRTHR